MSPEERAAFLNRPEIADWIARAVAAAPPLTDHQRARISLLLRPRTTGDQPRRIRGETPDP